MTQKEKAKQLVDKFEQILDHNDRYWKSEAHDCALIAIDEILSLNAESFDELPNPHHYYSKKYWLEVKKEIQNL